MQVFCEHCGESINTDKKIKHRRRDMVSTPKVFKTVICKMCGKKNFIRL